MKLLLFVASVLPLAVAVQETAAQQPSIVGTWQWTRRANSCTEQYLFRSDGTVAVKSGAEQTESTYLLSWAPEPNGRYKLTMTMVKDSGGPGCADNADERPDRRGVVYVLFGGSGQTMILCNSPAGADCIGPLTRSAP